MTRRVLQYVAVLLTGLVAGSTFTIWQGYDPRSLPLDAYIQVHTVSVEGLNVLLPILGMVSLLVLLVCAVLSRADRLTLGLFLLAAALMLVAGLTTRFVNQPINAEVITWTSDAAPPDWADLRDRWWDWHVLRTLCSLGGFAAALGAVFAATRMQGLWAAPKASPRLS
jgi:hypothetical protein